MLCKLYLIFFCISRPICGKQKSEDVVRGDLNPWLREAMGAWDAVSGCLLNQRDKMLKKTDRRQWDRKESCFFCMGNPSPLFLLTPLFFNHFLYSSPSLLPFTRKALSKNTDCKIAEVSHRQSIQRRQSDLAFSGQHWFSHWMSQIRKIVLTSKPQA